MNDGLLLMTDTRLQMTGFFGGILGLGLPDAAKEHSLSQPTETMQRPAAGAGAMQGPRVGAGQDIQGVMKRIIDQITGGRVGQITSGGGDGVGGIIDVGVAIPGESQQDTSKEIPLKVSSF